MVVYFVRAGNKGAIKIGVARDVKKRLATMQTGNPFELKVIALIPCSGVQQAFDTERRIHNLFKAKRIRGEWFAGDINFRSIRDAIDIIEDEPTKDQIREYQVISDRCKENKAGELSRNQTKAIIRKKNEERRMQKARLMAIKSTGADK